jgi:hypothetical protein
MFPGTIAAKTFFTITVKRDDRDTPPEVPCAKIAPLP